MDLKAIRRLAWREVGRTCRRPNPALVVAVVAVIAFSLMVLHHAMCLGVPREWGWEYRKSFAPWIGAAVPAFSFLLLVAVCFFVGERADQGKLKPFSRGVGLFLLVLVAFSLRCGLQVLAPPGKPAEDDPALVVISPVATSFFYESLRMDALSGGVRQFMREFPTRMMQFDRHAQTHPPGTILLYWGIRKLLEAPAVSKAVTQTGLFGNFGEKQKYVQKFWKLSLPMQDLLAAECIARLLPLMGVLFLIPVFAMARHFWGESCAWRMMLVAATVPGLLLFFPAVDQVYVLVSAIALWQLVKGVNSDKRRCVFWGGVWLGLGLMMTLAFLSLLAVVGLLALLVPWEWKKSSAPPPLPFGRMARHFVAFSAGVALPIIAGYLFLNIDFIAIAKTGLGAHRLVTHGESGLESFARTYWKWVIVNLLDFGGSLGVAWIVWMAFAVAQSQKRRELGGSADESDSRVVRLRILGVAWLLSILALDVSGVVRGEVARIWLFLIPVGLILCGPTSRLEDSTGEDAGRQKLAWRVRMNVEYTLFAGLQLLQAIVLQREVVFIRFW